jgi:hypothetical protein
MAHDQHRSVCIAFLIQLLTLDHGALESEDFMASESTIDLILSLFILPNPTNSLPLSPSALEVRRHTDAIFITFAFFTNPTSIIRIRRMLCRNVEKLHLLMESFFTRLRDTTHCATSHAIPLAMAINTVTQCFAIAHGLLDKEFQHIFLPWTSRILLETVRAVLCLSEKESATSCEHLLNEVVDFLKFVVKWTESSVFCHDPLIPLINALKGGALCLLARILLQLPEECEGHGVAML